MHQEHYHESPEAVESHQRQSQELALEDYDEYEEEIDGVQNEYDEEEIFYDECENSGSGSAISDVQPRSQQYVNDGSTQHTGSVAKSQYSKKQHYNK